MSSDIKYQLEQPGKRNLVFSNEPEMNMWVSANKDNLIRGQLLLVHDTDKSYWWNGTEMKEIVPTDTETYYNTTQVDEALNQCEKISNKGGINGYAPLNEYGKIPSSYIAIDADGLEGTIDLEVMKSVSGKVLLMVIVH